MCGIAGVWHLDGRPVSTGLVSSMRDALSTRGPDDAGTWVDGPVGLGHRRLAIIDLSAAGHQPMHGCGATTVLTYNGEIFNFKELRGELEGHGHGFRSSSDTEVLLAAYQQWGERCVERFVGMFAFAIWDRARRGLLLARDRLGIKPLYYAAMPATIIFGSRLGALLRHPACPRELDPESVNLFLQSGYVPAPRSILRGVRKLEAGHTLWLDHQGVRPRRYWSIDDIQVDASLAGQPRLEVVDHLDRLLRQSISQRLISDVSLGAFLSGGIDSSIVVALMKELSSTRPRTFTIGFADAAYDESRAAAAIAAHLGTEHHEEIIDFRQLLGALDDLSTHYDEPFADWSSLPTMMVSRFARRYVTVSLSGDGGDELFAGYPYYRFLERLAPAYKLPGVVRRLVGASLKASGRHRLVLLGHTLMHDDLIGGFAFMRSMAKDYGATVLDAPSGPSLETLYRERAARFPALDPVATASRLDAAFYLPDDILQKVDVASMSVGLEARVPLLDHRVVEFALSVPVSLNVQNREGKGLLRDVLARYVPRPLFERPKQGFGAPIREWFRGPLRETIRAELHPSRIREFGYLRPDAVQHLIDLHLSGRRDTHPVLWSLLCLLRWREQLMRTPAAAA